MNRNSRSKSKLSGSTLQSLSSARSDLIFGTTLGLLCLSFLIIEFMYGNLLVVVLYMIQTIGIYYFSRNRKGLVLVFYGVIFITIGNMHPLNDLTSYRFIYTRELTILTGIFLLISGSLIRSLHLEKRWIIILEISAMIFTICLGSMVFLNVVSLDFEFFNWLIFATYYLEILILLGSEKPTPVSLHDKLHDRPFWTVLSCLPLILALKVAFTPIAIIPWTYYYKIFEGTIILVCVALIVYSFVEFRRGIELTLLGFILLISRLTEFGQYFIERIFLFLAIGLITTGLIIRYRRLKLIRSSDILKFALILTSCLLFFFSWPFFGIWKYIPIIALSLTVIIPKYDYGIKNLTLVQLMRMFALLLCSTLTFNMLNSIETETLFKEIISRGLHFKIYI